MKIFAAIGFFLLPLTMSGQPCHYGGIAGSGVAAADSLNVKYSLVTGIPDPYKNPFYLALSYFPELDHSRIRVKSKKIRTTLNVRPALGSVLFNTKSNRKYIIRINNAIKDSIVTLDEVPFDALVGLFGHELTHIADYKNKNIWRILGRAFAYLSKHKKEKFEKEMDYLAIDHGLGCSLYQWSFFVLNFSDASAKYKEFKREIYLKPNEIQEYMHAVQK